MGIWQLEDVFLLNIKRFLLILQNSKVRQRFLQVCLLLTQAPSSLPRSRARFHLRPSPAQALSSLVIHNPKTMDKNLEICQNFLNDCKPLTIGSHSWYIYIYNMIHMLFLSSSYMFSNSLATYVFRCEILLLYLEAYSSIGTHWLMWQDESNWFWIAAKWYTNANEVWRPSSM